MALATLVLSELGPAGWVHLTAAVRLTFVRPVICSCRLPCCEVYDPAGRQTTNRTRRAVSNLDVANFLNGLDEINGSVLMASLATEPMVATALVRMLVRGVGAEGEEGDEHAKGAKAALAALSSPIAPLPLANGSVTTFNMHASNGNTDRTDVVMAAPTLGEALRLTDSTDRFVHPDVSIILSMVPYSVEIGPEKDQRSVSE